MARRSFCHISAVWSAIRRAYARCACTASHSSSDSADSVEEEEKRVCVGEEADEWFEHDASDEGEVV